MSRHHHAAVETAETILHDYKHLSPSEFANQYGLELRSDGSVYDVAYGQKFSSLNDWIEFEVEQEEMSYSEDYGHGKQTYEDFF